MLMNCVCLLLILHVCLNVSCALSPICFNGDFDFKLDLGIMLVVCSLRHFKKNAGYFSKMIMREWEIIIIRMRL